MKIIFDSNDEYEALRSAAHDACLYWLKVRQMCQGKINLNVDGCPTHFDEKYAIDMIVDAGRTLDTIEKSPHPEWDEATGEYVLVTEKYDSHMVVKCKKLVPTIA